MHIQIGETIKHRRAILKISQETLSELSGVGLRTIVKIENGKANPSLEVLDKIAEVLGMEISLQIKKPSSE
ncbi:MAG: helix-turn-helix domain-containing protein [Bacteroidales bacterium]|nr:helix-turn-helix domain-containing protein [Bacteroidales bacterium]